MGYISDGFVEALNLLVSLDPEVLAISWVSIKVASISTALSTIVGVPLGFLVGIGRFRGRNFLVSIFNTLMALPTVVIGLMVYSLISRRGPLGELGLLYTQSAMVIGQFILAMPIVAALTLAVIGGVDPRIRKTALALGATDTQSAWAILSESQMGILAAVVAGFGRVFAEVGISMMLGGNIRGYTRNIPTAIALETSKGEFALGIALGLILLGVAFGINLFLQMARRK